MSQKILDLMPGLLNAIDKTLIDETGKRVPFILVAFDEGNAMHATNVDVQRAFAALKDLIDNMGDKNVEITTPPVQPM